MSAETFAFSEGQVHFWTGSATASALVGYATTTRATLTKAWSNRPTLSGYCDELTGQRADLTVGALYVRGLTLQRWFDSAVQVHARLNHVHYGGSAGIVLYSGRIDSLTMEGGENGIFSYQLAYHANEWSGY